MTKPKPLPSIDYLRKRLRYEPETGKLFWLDHEGMPPMWRSRWAGKEAFTTKDKGYHVGGVDTLGLMAHRVAWAIYHGEWPSDQIDHINGITYDNRIINLRVVTTTENARNANMKSNNTSGITGVTWDNGKRRWKAQIMVNGRCVNLGRFKTIEEAAAVRKEAATKYGFTERHGTKAEEVE
jgi:hypothetical protein